MCSCSLYRLVSCCGCMEVFTIKYQEKNKLTLLDTVTEKIYCFPMYFQVDTILIHSMKSNYFLFSLINVDHV